MLQGKHYRLDHDGLIYIPPQTIHSYTFEPTDSEGWFDIIHIFPEGFSQIISQSVFSTIADSAPALMGSGSPGMNSVAGSFNSLRDSRIADYTTAAHLLLLIQAYTDSLKTGNGILPLVPGKRISQDVNEFLRRIVDYTEKHFSCHILLEDLVRITGYSRSHVCRLFSNTVHMHYSTYLLLVRLNNGRKLLYEGRNVSDAAFLSGFETTSYFIKKFKEQYKTTPGHYRKDIDAVYQQKERITYIPEFGSSGKSIL